MTEPPSPHPDGTWLGFQEVMPHRVHDILLVSSVYDSFILAEDGQLNERILSESLELNLRHVPLVTRVSTGAEALARGHAEPGRFDLVIASLHVGDMNALTLAHRMKEAGFPAPLVVLAYDNRELTAFLERHDTSALEEVFLWQGDVRVLVTIVKVIEDRWNVAHDTGVLGIQAIIVVEDSIRFASSFLPVIYAELINHSHKLVPEGINLSDKLTRLQARPKILLCRTFEKAWEMFSAYQENVLGVISDIEFPKGGLLEPHAGLELAAKIRAAAPDVAIMLQSSKAANEPLARAAGLSFLLKGSPLHLQELRRFMVENFGFGDFVFRLPDGTAVGRASDLKELEEALWTVPVESLAYHGERNHFSAWLKARTEFALAARLRPRTVAEFGTLENFRRNLVSSIHEYRKQRGRGIMADFDPTTFDEATRLARLGGGSLGGKARGLAFMNMLMSASPAAAEFPGVRIQIPPALILGTDVFDRFLDENHLRGFAIDSEDDEDVRRRFIAADFPEDVSRDLSHYLQVTRHPLAVRSSSLLEDSKNQPFAGVYETWMLPNNSASLHFRLTQLVQAIKKVYASAFSSHAKAYLSATPYRLEEEKMAVILQKLVGSAHGGRFYPSMAGVVRSHNFYPTPPMTTNDGIAAVALGFGESVVNGDACVRFCPRYPHHLVQFSSVSGIRQSAQREFFALQVAEPEVDEFPARGSSQHGFELRRFGLEAAEADGTLAAVASTYSPENDAVYDGISRPGVRLVSFAPILKHDLFPLAAILDFLLGLATQGTGAPVEIEFAVNLSSAPGTPKEFGLLQLRPLALSRELSELEIGQPEPADLLCQSRKVLGNGLIKGIRDLVVVDFLRFERSRSRDAAAEVAVLNRELVAAAAPYLLIGVGRLGSADPLLGIPVRWDEISGARVIVESGFRDIPVEPSQGTHFFQNITANNIGYFTVNPEAGEGLIDWEWLAAQPAVAEASYVRHIHLDEPLLVKMNGHKNEGVILKPGVN